VSNTVQAMVHYNPHGDKNQDFSCNPNANSTNGWEHNDMLSGVTLFATWPSPCHRRNWPQRTEPYCPFTLVAILRG